MPTLPILLALLGAAMFGVSSLVARFGLRHVDARQGSLISIGATAAFLWLLFPVFWGEAAWTPERLLRFVAIFAGVGAVSPSISLFLAFEGNRYLGPTISGTIASSAPLFAAASAFLVLGEVLTPGLALGTLGIVVGVMVLSWHGSGPRTAPWWAALLPLGAAALRGAAQMTSKLGFSVAPAPYLGVLTTFSVSFLLVLAVYRLQGRRLAPGGLRALTRGGARWFVLTGVLNGMALLCVYAALNAGRVVVVSPVVSTFPLFTFAISLAFGIERLGLRIFAGMLMVVLGVVVVSTQ